MIVDTFDVTAKAISNEVSARLVQAAKTAEKAIPHIVKKWFKGETKIHGATFKAICRRDGSTYINKHGNKSNFNEQISEVFERAYGHAWGRVVRVSIPGLLKSLENTSRASIQEPIASIERHVKCNSPQIFDRLNTSIYRMIQLQIEASTNLTNAFETFRKSTSKVGNIPQKRVQKRMIPIYRKCSTDSGKHLLIFYQWPESLTSHRSRCISEKPARILTTYRENKKSVISGYCN